MEAQRSLRIFLWFFVLFACYYFAQKKDKRNYSWKDILWIIFFSYLWLFVNVFIHELGHALTNLAFGAGFKEINIGIGWKLVIFCKGKIIFNILPFGGVAYPLKSITNQIQRIIVLAMGVIAQFIFLGLVYWLVKRNKKVQKTLIGDFIQLYALKITFWLKFIFNVVPFVHPRSDWTQITRIILGWK
jgi:FtsH-binding integral membrane protein